MQETHKIALDVRRRAWSRRVAQRCTEVESGARNVDNILTNTLLPEISRQILGRLAERQQLESIHVGDRPGRVVRVRVAKNVTGRGSTSAAFSFGV